MVKKKRKKTKKKEHGGRKEEEENEDGKKAGIWAEEKKAILMYVWCVARGFSANDIFLLVVLSLSISFSST